MSETFTGNEVREIRRSLGLSRAAMAKILGVATVTVEKWEQSKEKTIRSKYSAPLMNLTGAGLAGAGIGAAAAPALLPVAVIAALSALGVSALLGDRELDAAITMMERLKKLKPAERQTLVQLILKSQV